MYRLFLLRSMTAFDVATCQKNEIIMQFVYSRELRSLGIQEIFSFYVLLLYYHIRICSTYHAHAQIFSEGKVSIEQSVYNIRHYCITKNVGMRYVTTPKAALGLKMTSAIQFCISVISSTSLNRCKFMEYCLLIGMSYFPNTWVTSMNAQKYRCIKQPIEKY